MSKRRKIITKELRNHAPFTVFGAVTGMVLMFFFYKIPSSISYNIFYVAHPAHILVSALATASMYELYKCPTERKKCNPWVILAVGFAGSIGLGTLSDSLFPYFGEVLLDMPNREAHIGFIEKWWLVNPLALLGIAIAYFRPSTRVPHSAHVLLSTWASLFHIIMSLGKEFNFFLFIPVFLLLFIAVWLPCCISDIVFPLLFVYEEGENTKV